MILSVLEGHSPIAILFKCDIVYLWCVARFLVCRASCLCWIPLQFTCSYNFVSFPGFCLLTTLWFKETGTCYILKQGNHRYQTLLMCNSLLAWSTWWSAHHCPRQQPSLVAGQPVPPLARLAQLTHLLAIPTTPVSLPAESVGCISLRSLHPASGHAHQHHHLANHAPPCPSTHWSHGMKTWCHP